MSYTQSERELIELRMQKWSRDKLEAEDYFASPNDGFPEWRELLNGELARRGLSSQWAKRDNG